MDKPEEIFVDFSKDPIKVVADGVEITDEKEKHELLKDKQRFYLAYKQRHSLSQ